MNNQINNELSLYLNIKISKNSLGNFDKSKIQKELKTIIDKKAFLILKDNDKILKLNFQTESSSKEGDIILFFIRINKNIRLENTLLKNCFKMTEDNFNSLNYKLWYVIKSDPSNNENVNDDYYLTQDDIIRFGNFKFILKTIHIKNYNNNNNTNHKKYDIHGINKGKGQVFNFISKLEEYIIEPKNDIFCEICKKNSCDKDNPLIKLCVCENYKHFECIKQDIVSKLIPRKNKKETSINYYLNFHCFKCKISLPLRFKIENIDKIYKLIDIEEIEKVKDNEDYLFFESIDYLNKYEEYEKSFHLIKLEENEKENITVITIGRDGSQDQKRDNDIKILDNSVSRGNHAIIEYNKKNGTLLLKNKSQRSDTLVLIKDAIEINKNKIHLQIGRIFIEASLLDKNKEEEIKKENIFEELKTKKEYEEEIKKIIENNKKDNNNKQEDKEITIEDYFNH